MIVTFAIFSSCEPSEKRVTDAKSEVVKANQALDKANADYRADMKAYRKEKAEMIAANDSTIASLKGKIYDEKKNVNTAFEKKIIELEEQNKALKVKMDNLNDEGKDKWESFKREFSHDMDEIGKALKDLTVNNKN